MPNLVKQRYIVSDNRQARVINSNDKLEEIYRDMNMKREDLQSPPEFEAGLFAERVEVSEELSDWEEDAPVAEVVQEENVQQMLEDARIEAEEILKRANEEALQIRENAYNEGFAEGTRKAELQLQEEQMELQTQYGNRLESLEQEYNATLEQMEPQMVDAFINIIREVLAVELSQYSEIISELIFRTIKQLDNPKKVVIYVCPENYPLLKEKESLFAENLGQGAELEIVRDDKILETQCKIETERGIYDCGFDVQLDNLLKKIKLLSNRS